MKRHAEAADAATEFEEGLFEEGPAHRFKVVEPANLIVGQQYRIHRKEQPAETDELGPYDGIEAAHGFPTFNQINGFDPETRRRFKDNVRISRSPEDYIFINQEKQ